MLIEWTAREIRRRLKRPSVTLLTSRASGWPKYQPIDRSWPWSIDSDCGPVLSMNVRGPGAALAIGPRARGVVRVLLC